MSSYLPKLLFYFSVTFYALYFLWSILYPYLYYFNLLCASGFLAICSWSFAYYVFDKYNQDTVSSKDKVVLITGCDTGFGNRLVRKLDRLGYIVYAGCLLPDGDGAKSLKEVCSERLQIVKMDVTKREDVESVVQQIREGKKGLWAVVNNAGIAIGTPFDWGDDVEVHSKTFDVNLLGLIRTTKYCIPLLRESNGRVVNVASLAGRVTSPLISAYCMAKHSVRVFSNVLRQELCKTDIKVVTLEPTFYKTNIVDFEKIHSQREKLFERTPIENRKYYDKELIQSMNKDKSLVDLITRTDIDEVVDAMVKGVTLQSPKLFYRCCSYLDVLLLWAPALGPEIIYDLLASSFYSNISGTIVKAYMNLKKKFA